MQEILEKDVKYALEHGVEELKLIHKRILELYIELGDTEAMIRSTSMKSSKYGFVSGGGAKWDLSDLLQKHEVLQKQREIEIKEQIWRLTDEEAMINRIRTCYQTLRGEEYNFLQKLYVQKKPYKSVEKDSGVSHRTFEKIRKTAMRKVISLFESNYSNQEIITMGHSYRKRECGREKT